MIMDLYGYLSLLVMVLVIVFGGVAMIRSSIDVWVAKRRFARAQREHAQAKEAFFRTHGY